MASWRKWHESCALKAGLDMQDGDRWCSRCREQAGQSTEGGPGEEEGADFSSVPELGKVPLAISCW